MYGTRIVAGPIYLRAARDVYLQIRSPFICSNSRNRILPSSISNRCPNSTQSLPLPPSQPILRYYFRYFYSFQFTEHRIRWISANIRYLRVHNTTSARVSISRREEQLLNLGNRSIGTGNFADCTTKDSLRARRTPTSPPVDMPEARLDTRHGTRHRWQTPHHRGISTHLFRTNQSDCSTLDILWPVHTAFGALLHGFHLYLLEEVLALNMFAPQLLE